MLLGSEGKPNNLKGNLCEQGENITCKSPYQQQAEEGTQDL